VKARIALAKGDFWKLKELLRGHVIESIYDVVNKVK